MADVIEFARNGAPRPTQDNGPEPTAECVEVVPEINAELVRNLETWLTAARTGEMTSGAMVGVYLDGSVRTGWDKTPDDTDALASGILCLQHRYARSMCD